MELFEEIQAAETTQEIVFIPDDSLYLDEGLISSSKSHGEYFFSISNEHPPKDLFYCSQLY